MKERINKILMLALILISSVFILAVAAKAEALEPKLLWDKTVPFKISDIKMAAQSGDVILYSQKARQIILYDKNGNKLFQWGPRIDRQPMGVEISEDGSVILYETSRTEKYALKSKIGNYDKRMHYVTRKGKELWNKQISGSATLSPDGKVVAIYPSAGEGVDLTMLDSQGKVLWKYITDEVRDFSFSSDSNYLIFSSAKWDMQSDGKEVVLSGEPGLHFLDKSGKLLWKKLDDKIGAISVDATFVITEKRIYDRQGNTIIEAEPVESINNGKIVLRYPDKISILKWPERTVIKEVSLSRFKMLRGRDSSCDDRIMIFSGQATGSTNNLFVYDIETNSSWETKIATDFDFYLSSDGRYLLVILYKLNKLLLYQVY